MQKRQPGKSGLEVSAIGFGCMSFAGNYGPAGASLRRHLGVKRALALAAACLLSAVALPGRCEEPKHSPDTGGGPWAMSSSSSSFKDYQEWFPKMDAAGVRSVRLFPEWNGFEPAKGEWKFEPADAMLKTAAENHLQITGMLFGAAPWSKKPGHSFPMTHLDDWSNYVSTVVDHYKDRMHYWEVWNEGNAGFNDLHNTTADYAELAARAYEAVKKADPTAQVGLSVASFDAAYLDQVILAQTKLGKPNSFDYLCIHPYETLGMVREVDGEVPYLWMTRMLRDELKADAPAKKDAEIWITEVGMPVGKKVSESDADKAMVKAYVMAIAQGISRVMWFEARDPAGEEAGFGLLRRDGTPRPSYESFKTMTAVLGEKPKYLGWVALGSLQRGYGFVFQGPSGPVLVGWAAANNECAVQFSGDVNTIDSLSNIKSAIKAQDALMLTDTPTFVTQVPADLVAQAKANAGKNFPWGGDYSAEKTVSLQLGHTSVSHGVHPVGMKPLLSLQFKDGTSGAKMAANAPATFYVHPSFASIMQREYYIRLTLRRIGPGNLGMNINYEVADTQGQHGPMRHNGGWYSVGPGMEWQTHTWHVTDACFAKMWGFDFSFQPEQSVPFVIGKVEVSTQPFGD